MKISYNWLKDFINTELSSTEIAEILTDIGLEVEGIENKGISIEDLDKFVVGEVISCENHPNADKLKVTQVDLGDGVIEQIVCGAPNVAKGQKVPVATSGAIIKDENGNEFQIKKVKLRGESSNGMICSKKELRLSDDHDGIWVMDESLTPGTPLSDVIETSNETIFEIGLTPNRADAMSHFGVARDLFAALKSRNYKAKIQYPTFDKIKTTKKDNPIKVEVLDSENCPRYAGIFMKNIQVSDSPQWLQNRLKSIGLTPVNNVVDITNFVLHSLGQPMHAFDADKIHGNKIIVQSNVYETNHFQTLDKTERKLQGNELLICDSEKPIAIAGVMGGLETSVTHETKNIFLESAYFNPVSVRKTSKQHQINSDSSFRFERGIDPNITLKAIEMAVALIVENAQGKVQGEIFDHYPTPLSNHRVALYFNNVNRLIGEEISRKEIIKILELLEIEILNRHEEYLILDVPAYRVDVQREADVIEEILRIYGFNKIDTPKKMSFSIVSGNGFPEDQMENSIADMLVNQGFYEAMNLSMYPKKFNENLGFEDDKSIDVLNSLSADLAVMRRSLLPGLLENISFNVKRKKEQIKLFEFGKSYVKIKSHFKENKSLGIIISGQWTAENWQLKQENVNASHLKGILQQILTRFNLRDYQLETSQNSFEENGISYWVANKKIAQLSKISKNVLKKFDVQQDVFYAEIDIEEIYKLKNKQGRLKYKTISKFPAVRRDLALLLDKSVSYQEVKNLVLKSETNFIRSINLFDVYEGDKLENNKKSYAISIILQDENKTMNDLQIDQIMKKIINTLKSELNAELRT